jgi:hypothetical protein
MQPIGRVPTPGLLLQVIAFELLTKKTFYGEEPTMQSVVDALVGSSAFCTEPELPAELHSALGKSVFRNNVLAMLSRDPKKRPAAADVVRDWNTVFAATISS